MPEERRDIITLAKNDKYMDISHRQLSVVASETGELEASASSFYRLMKQEQLMEKRQRTPKTPQTKPEVKVDGPNQVWSWDLTYIALGPIFVYLFAIIDVYSRKIVGWHLGFNARVESMKQAWDRALVNENLIGVSGAPKLPIALSDHGVQMAERPLNSFSKIWVSNNFLLDIKPLKTTPGLNPGSVSLNMTGYGIRITSVSIKLRESYANL